MGLQLLAHSGFHSSRETLLLAETVEVEMHCVASRDGPQCLPRDASGRPS
jgi:hypothetical protein